MLAVAVAAFGGTPAAAAPAAASRADVNGDGIADLFGGSLAVGDFNGDGLRNRELS